MSDEQHGPEAKVLKGLILKRLCPLLVALFVCLSVTKGNVSEEPKHVNATLGENVVLFCSFEFPENKPVPYVIQWHKQGIKIPIYIWYKWVPPHSGVGYKGRLSLAYQASLNLTNVRQTDQGWYECRVYFLNRPPDSPINGTWVHLDVYVPLKFKTKPPDAVYVKVGESVTLPCEAEGSPLPNLIWYKDNSPLDESSTVQILSTELRINNLLQTDKGNYTCKARNKQGTVTATSKVIIDESCCSYVPEEPKRISANIGEDVVLFCDFEFPANKPVPHVIQWHKQGIKQPIYNWYEDFPPHLGVGYEGRLSLAHQASLNLTKVRLTDKGWYECKVYFLNRPPDSPRNGTWVHLDVRGLI